MRKLRLAGLDAHVLGGTDGRGGGDGPVIVLFHGFGAPGTDLLPLAGEVPAPAGTRWVFPMAPLGLEPGELNEGAPRAWWLIDMIELQVATMTQSYDVLAERVPEGIDDARTLVDAFLSELSTTFGVSSERIVLGGFSQGAMLATDTVLRSQQRYAGLAIFSGTVLSRPVWRQQSLAHAGLPTLVSHGRQDPILPFVLAEELREMLLAAELDVTWVPFAGGHGIPAAALQAFAELLRKIASKTADAR